MADGNGINSKEVKQFGKGLHTDNSPQAQPEGTLRFALNCVDETEVGDMMFPTNLESNIEAGALPDGYIPIGKVYMVNGETCLFLVGPNGESEIGVYNDNGTYTTYVNDSQSTNKLNFRVTHQIDAVYRLRRGCDKTVYWTDNLNPVRQYILNKPEDYLSDNNLDIDKFELFRFTKKIPFFQGFEIREEGNLESGSYNFSIQYLDEDLNPTQWIILSDTINIYKDKITNKFSEVRGSTNEKSYYHQFGNTGKCIVITISNVDESFPYYRIATIKAIAGTGFVSEVTVSEPISTIVHTYIEDGAEKEKISVEEIYQEPLIIETAQSIEQIENRLLLGNVKNKQIDLCDLQKYASRIRSYCVVKKVNLTDLKDPSNGKNPTKRFVGYTPGEIYSFGIVYLFKDGTTSPVYHIPGVNSQDYSSSGMDLTPEINNRELKKFGMSSNNTISTFYTESNSCEDKDYWGTDSFFISPSVERNLPLKNTPVRHHRFPTRSELNSNLVNKLVPGTNRKITKIYDRITIPEDSTVDYNQYKDENIRIVYSANTGVSETYMLHAIGRTSNTYTFEDISNLHIGDKISGYRIGGNLIPISEPTNTVIDIDTVNKIVTFSEEVHPADPSQIFVGVYLMYIQTQESILGEFNFTLGNILDLDGNIIDNEILIDTLEYDIASKVTFTIYQNISLDLIHTPSIRSQYIQIEGVEYESEILGIRFENIEIPELENEEIVGYYIVRNERKEEDKTILDTALLFPLVEYEKFISFGNISPSNIAPNSNAFVNRVLRGEDGLVSFNIEEEDRKALENPVLIRKDMYGFIHPKHLFEKKEYTNNVEFYTEGNFIHKDGNIFEVSSNLVEDTYPGTTYDPAYHKGKEKDSDGLTLHTLSKYRDFSYENSNNRNINLFGTDNIKDIFYLDALGNKNIKINDISKEIFNISSDNRIGIIQLNSNIDIFNETKNIIEKAYTWYNKDDGDTANYSSRVETSNISKYPYVILKRNISTSYQDFRTRAYYKESSNFNIESSCNIFNGDSYISPLTYNSTIYYGTVPKKRETKNTTWRFILGGILTIVGIVGGIFTAGATTTLVGIGVGLIVGAAAVTAFKSGLVLEKLADVYRDKYEEGLRETTKDATTILNFRKNTLLDDEIQWYNNIFANLWFESGVNINLRQGNTVGLPDFIDAPTEYNEEQMNLRAVNKISSFDPEQDQGRLYQGFAIAEDYEINKDYNRFPKEKFFFHLGLEYDCCSDCIETFPHRIHYSEQSFQEENVDNYRVFLPNNYRDINGETGEITNIFRIQNNLFVHTEEAIWKLPKNYQERITDEIVSFIGTGSYFSIPPQKLVDDETGNSYGTVHKWSRLKTPYGYFFVSENQNCICQFDGNQVKNISQLGNYYWFYNHIPILSDTLYKDNPSNPNGAGFLAAYDSKKDLIFYTKIDRLPTGENNSWTISFNLKKNAWGSWHSFIPNFYIQTTQWYFSWINGNNNIWRHNVLGNYQTYYGELKPFIIEYVLTDNVLSNKLFDTIMLQLESKKYDPISKTFFDTDRDFFNKIIVYNSRQCTGELDIIVKDKEDFDFLFNQIQNNNLQSIVVDRNERNWYINDLRDMVVAKNAPMFITDIKQFQDKYFIDKVLNNAVINFNKDWTQIENFSDKYLVVRLIFDKFADIKLITNFTVNDETISLR
jgi:hypothetical protein